jgi:hypothetical protein
MSGQRQLIYAAITFVILAGCVSSSGGSFRNPLGSFVTYATIPVQFIDSETQIPIPDLKISRLDPIPNTNSIWNLIRYGEADEIKVPVATTNEKGIASIAIKDVSSQFECYTSAPATLKFNCSTKKATYTPWMKGVAESVEIEIQEIEPKLLQIIVPSSK